MNAYGLIADIGGTNARFALVEPQAGEGEFSHVSKLKCADFPSLEQATEHYLQTLDKAQRPSVAVIAVASPVEDGVIEMTNHLWGSTVELVEKRLGLDRLIAINDFEAIAHAGAIVPTRNLLQIGETPTPDFSSRKRVQAVVGPGTGFGVALLITGLGEPIVMATEGGHASFAPQNDHQLEIARFLRHDYPRLSVERLLSGPGLVALHRALSALNDDDAPDLKPADITRLALQGEPLCRATLNEFYAILGSVAGDIALTTGARAGVLIGGGILPPLADDFCSSQFRHAFEDKGRFSSYNQAIPTYLINTEEPGLVGASAVLNRYRAAH